VDSFTRLKVYLSKLVAKCGHFDESSKS